MGESARVQSVDALRLFRAALYKFIEAGTVALGDCEAELHRVCTWLDTEANSYWTGQIRKREEILSKAKEALRMKTLFKDSTGRTPTALEEQKAVTAAIRSLEEAQQKLLNVRRWNTRMQREVQNYKGSVARLATDLSADVPAAAARLDSLVGKLEEYMTIAAPDSPGTSGYESTPHAPPPQSSPDQPPDHSMARPADQTPPTANPPQTPPQPETEPSST